MVKYSQSQRRRDSKTMSDVFSWLLDSSEVHMAEDLSERPAIL